MTVHPSARNLIRQTWPKQRPRTKRVKNPNEAKTRVIVADRSGGRCERCAVARAGSVHHRRKRSAGGEWSPSNCVALCGHGTLGCHSWVEHNPDAAAAAGWHVRPWQDPREVAVHSHLHGVVLLDDTGGVTPTEGGAA
jgi:hypothetical protein